MNTKIMKCLRYFCKRSNILVKQTAEMGDAVATEFVTTRDGNGHSCPLLPPGDTILQLESFEAPTTNAGSFSFEGVDMPYVGNPTYTFSRLITKKPNLTVIRYQRHGDLVGMPDVPPPDAWLIDPKRDRLETPVDDRGLVQQDALIDMVYDLIDPNFRWPKELSIDHVYHDEEWYYSVWAPECGGEFRELPIHKMLVRRMWENVKHKVVIPPAVPSEEVMRYRLESWAVASGLLRSIRNTERVRYFALQRFVERGGSPGELTDEFFGLDEIAQEWALDRLSRYARVTEIGLERLERIPPEFRLVRPDTPLSEMAERLAKIAGAEALHMVNRPAA